MKRKVVLCVSATAVLLFLILAGNAFYRNRYKLSEVSSYENEQYKLTIYQVGEPVFPFGAGKCRAVLSKDGDQLSRTDIILANGQNRRIFPSSGMTILFQ